VALGMSIQKRCRASGSVHGDSDAILRAIKHRQRCDRVTADDSNDGMFGGRRSAR